MPLNGYSYFLDFKAAEAGMKNLTFPEKQNLFDDAWNGMSEEEKDKFRSKAKAKKAKKNVQAPKMSATEIEITKLRSVQKKISEIVSKAPDLTTLPILVVDVTLWLKYLPPGQTEHRYVPAEVAIYELNLKFGILRNFQVLLSPLGVGKGFAYQLSVYAQDHKIDPQSPMLESDLELAWMDLLDFLKLERGSPITMFALSAKLDDIKGGLDGWQRQAGHDAEIDILPLSELMYQMGQLCPAPPVTSAHQANVMLSSTTVYMYKAEIMCPDYHRSSDEDKDWPTQACALARARIQTSIFLEHLCLAFGIKMSGDRFMII